MHFLILIITLHIFQDENKRQDATPRQLLLHNYYLYAANDKDVVMI